MIIIDLSKAKIIAHSIRRARREAAFAPLDEAISLRIPGTDLDALEAQRQVIRDTDALEQIRIDAATTVAELYQILGEQNG